MEERFEEFEEEQKSSVIGIVTKSVLFTLLIAAAMFAAFMVWRNMYIYHYNKGNEFYLEGDYANAQRCYEEALKCAVPAGKECDIRVNLVLSRMYQTQVRQMDQFAEMAEEDAEKAWEEIKKQAEAGIKILAEKGCAHEEDDEGHDKDAQTLMDELKKLLEEQNSDDSSSEDENEDENEDQNQDQNDGGEGEDPSEKPLEQLEDVMDDANGDRTDYNVENRGGDGGDGGDYSEWSGYYGEVW